MHGSSRGRGVSMSSARFMSLSFSEGYSGGYDGVLAASNELLAGKEKLTMQNLNNHLGLLPGK
ncbi:Keratin, type I cytoskeletal 19, partial [Saguinus oedipus]